MIDKGDMMRLLVLLVSICSSILITAVSYASPLEIEISLNENPPRRELSVNYPFNFFFIAAKIINVSDDDQEITLWSCSYEWSWIVNSPGIIIGSSVCPSNVGSVVVLKSKESLSQNVYVMLSSKTKIGPLTFQMGYSPGLDRDGKYISDKQRISNVTWSNPITIEITHAMVDRPESEILELKNQKAQPSGKSI